VAVVIRKLPFSRAQTVSVPGGSVDVLPYQIAVWVSVAPKYDRALRADMPRFPAVLDTGFGGSFLLREHHLIRWAGLRREHLREVDSMRVYGVNIPVHAANVWVHPNVPGTREPAANAEPFCIRLDPGVGVCPPGLDRPRLPLLGMRGLFFGDLQIGFNWNRSHATVRTTAWWDRLFGA
jgi:hypothetical protein